MYNLPMANKKNFGNTKKKNEDYGWVIKLVVGLFIFCVVGLGVSFYIEGKRIDPSDLQYKFIKEYSDLNNAYQMMKKKDFDFEVRDKRHGFARKFAGFFKLESVCEDYSDACLWNNITYKTLDGNIIAVYLGAPNVGQFRTVSGALYMLYSFENDLWIMVDTNGIVKGPNRFGVDLFGYYIRDNNSGLKFMGERTTPYSNLVLYCNPEESNKYNGLSCPYKAFIDKEYFPSTIEKLYSNQ